MNQTILSSLDIEWLPLLPWIWLAGLGALIGLVLTAGLYLRARGLILRSLLFATMLLILCNPSVVKEQRRSEPDIILLLVDQSESQKIGDRPEQIEKLLQPLEEQLGDLNRVETRKVVFGADLRDESSSPFLALERELASIEADRLGAVIIVSDGQAHDLTSRFTLGKPGGQLPKVFAKLNAPVHVLLTGNQSEFDRRIELLTVPGYGLVGQRVEARVRIETSGESQGSDVILDVSSADKLIASRSVKAGSETLVSLPLDHAGANHFDLSIREAEGELTVVNNKSVVTVHGVRDRLHVLLVSGQPHQGGRTWRNFLKSDAAVDLIHFTILRLKENRDSTPVDELSLIPFPVFHLFQESIQDFDLIIFDQYPLRSLLSPSYFDNIASFVRDGGALLVASGPSFASPASIYNTALRDVLPARPTGVIYEQKYLPTVTLTGLKHPVTSALAKNSFSGSSGESTPWAPWFRQVSAVARKGDVLMTGVNDDPLLVLDRVGEGRVAQLLSDQVWLWARGYEGGGPHAELLRRVSHWLMAEPELDEVSLTAVANGDRLEIKYQTLDDLEGIEANFKTSTGEPTEIKLNDRGDGLWSAKTEPMPNGLYELSAHGKTVYAAVGKLNPIEFSDPVASFEKLAPLADATGGAILWLEDIESPRVKKVALSRRLSGSDWIGIRSNGIERTTGLSSVSLFSSLLALLLIAGLMLIVWVRESK